MKTERKYYVARFKVGDKTYYACEGYETGMGKTIERTTSISNAKKFRSPGGIMAWMGGHYSDYEAVPVTELIEQTIGEPEAYPPEDEVWPD